MSRQCPQPPAQRADASADAPHNITDIVRQRYKDSPKDDRDRLLKCWGIMDCGDCHRSDCGWCPISSTCLPLPNDPLSRAFPLLAPIRYKFICAEGPERFELRTSGLGCQVSTITFLTSVVTIFATLFGVLVLYYSFRCAQWFGLGWRSRRGGWIMYGEEIVRVEDVWVRSSVSWGTWWRKRTGEQKEFEIDEIVDGSPRKNGKTWWTSLRLWRPEGQGAESRPLLSSSSNH
ncbi:hypothetical protein BKA63DRAFT_517549 [Paraphoma chrysanthemicola]|nr:hypothetical protein BKA63DRAFT_517549 [Paraphoma chrysanthemicola]